MARDKHKAVYQPNDQSDQVVKQPEKPKPSAGKAKEKKDDGN